MGPYAAGHCPGIPSSTVGAESAWRPQTIPVSHLAVITQSPGVSPFLSSGPVGSVGYPISFQLILVLFFKQTHIFINYPKC